MAISIFLQADLPKDGDDLALLNLDTVIIQLSKVGRARTPQHCQVYGRTATTTGVAAWPPRLNSPLMEKQQLGIQKMDWKER